MENTTVVPTHKTTEEDVDKIRTLLVCGPVPGEELSYVDLTELRQPVTELPNLFRCRCIFVDDGKGTIVYDNVYTFFKIYGLQCDNFHHEHGGSGKGHFNSGSTTNIVNTGLHTPGTYFGNLIEKKISRVRLMKDMMSGEFQSVNTDTYVDDD
jgi:hypothetical protein